MKLANRLSLAIAGVILPYTFGQNAKTYKHASGYQIAILDQNLRVSTGTDITLGKNTTDAKLGAGGQGIHVLHTSSGDYRVEAPVNKGMTFLSAMGSNAYHSANTFHNKWFLDNVQPGARVLFAANCATPNKKHPDDAVRCTFFFPDPDSSNHEYETIGDFTPYVVGDRSNTAKTAGVLCNTGKLKPEVEAELCLPGETSTGYAVPSAVAPVNVSSVRSPIPATPTVAFVGNQRPVLTSASAAHPGRAPVVAAMLPAAPAMPIPPPFGSNEPAATGPSMMMLAVGVESNVKGADIEVDGRFAGNTPSTITVSPGQHLVAVKKNGYATWYRSLSVSGNGVHIYADMNHQAQSTTTRAARTHTLELQCYPASACANGAAPSSRLTPNSTIP